MKFLYFLYVLRTTSFLKLYLHAHFYAHRLHCSTFSMLRGALWGFVRYEVHPMKYFCLHFPERPIKDMQEHASTLFMNRFHRNKNSRKARACFQNKAIFLNEFSKFTRRQHFALKDDQREAFRQWLRTAKPQHMMAKTLFGACGKGIRKLEFDYRPDPVLLPEGMAFDEFFPKLISEGFGLVEEFVIQHPEVSRWNPSCVNTIRMVTILKPDGQPLLFEAILRLGSGDAVDNLSSGGVAIHIDLETGQTKGRGFQMEPSEEEFFDVHPQTGVPLNGLTIPYWKEIVEMVTQAAHVIQGAGTVGWDVAITPEGPCLIEGNDNWGVTIVEKAKGHGIRRELEPLMA